MKNIKPNTMLSKIINKYGRNNKSSKSDSNETINDTSNLNLDDLDNGGECYEDPTPFNIFKPLTSTKMTCDENPYSFYNPKVFNSGKGYEDPTAFLIKPLRSTKETIDEEPYSSYNSKVFNGGKGYEPKPFDIIDLASQPMTDDD